MKANVILKSDSHNDLQMIYSSYLFNLIFHIVFLVTKCPYVWTLNRPDSRRANATKWILDRISGSHHQKVLLR